MQAARGAQEELEELEEKRLREARVQEEGPVPLEAQERGAARRV